ncbi:MAG: hypothetical protein RR314_03285 [Oscillospiraceae bacterium]
MRRAYSAILMITLILLAACGRDEGKERFESFRAELLRADEVSVTAEVNADYGESARDYTLKAVSNAEGCTVEVLAPELIAGIKASVKPKSSQLLYDGVVLDTGDLTDDGLTPLSALPRLIGALQSGHVDRIRREGDALALRLTPDDTLEISVRFGADGTPISAELADSASGRVLVTCAISQFLMQ